MNSYIKLIFGCIGVTDEELKNVREKISLELHNSEADALYEEYIELSGCNLKGEPVPKIFQLLLQYLVNLRDPLIPANLYPSLVHKFRNAEPAYRGIVFLKEVLVNDLPPATGTVVKEILQIIHRCYFIDLLITSPELISKLEELLFPSFFGQPDKKQVQELRKIFHFIVKFPGYWFGVCRVYMLLDVAL